MIAANETACPAVTPGTLADERVQAMLRQLSLADREAVALATRTMVQYYGDEVASLREAEETAALRAMPPGHRIEDLNGLNVGCGDRPIHPPLLGIDVRRSGHLRGWCDALPFRSESIDFIVALHVLEREHDPVATVLHWLDVVKPGGGVGIVVSDWRYTWDARHDHDPWSHRWNPTPRLLEQLHARHWAHAASLERLDTYPFKLSFDVVLRKHGTFAPFDGSSRANRPTGHDLHEAGLFLHE